MESRWEHERKQHEARKEQAAKCVHMHMVGANFDYELFWCVDQVAGGQGAAEEDETEPA